MPELPEIETIRRSMLEVAPGPIRSLTIRRPDIVRQQDFPPERLTGKTWQEIRRRGKFLSFHFGEARVMTVHLGMSGRCYLTDSAPEETHVHLVILLEGGLAFIFQDPRRFGGIWFTLGEREQLALLGPEPLEAAFTELYLASILRRRKTAVKNILLYQRLLAGLGNINADEAL
jgi:formamidopyrimidine-DNA glycosylase